MGTGIERMSTVITRRSHNALRGASTLALLASAALLSGCMSSPTYGTGKTANSQLIDDIGGALNPMPKRKPAIDYKPRPDIVQPGSEEEAQIAGLPAPQDNVATSSNPAWPESPEQRRARIRAEATANRDDIDFDPDVDVPVDKTPSMAIEQRGNYSGKAYDPQASMNKGEQLKKLKQESEQGTPTERKFLSEPPLEYRVPAATAAAGELGEDEKKKEAQRKKSARKKSGDSSWRDLIPWL